MGLIAFCLVDNNKDIQRKSSSIPNGVGASSAKWFIAIVNSRCEKASADKLSKLGIENYVPTQTIIRVWKNGKKAKVDKVAISNVVFIHCTEEKRREIVNLPFIFRFMTNRAGGPSERSLNKPLATISESEISRLKFMLGQSDIPVTITDRPYQVGDKVRIIRGALAGLEGEVYHYEADNSEVVVALETFGCAKLIIETLNLEIIN